MFYIASFLSNINYILGSFPFLLVVFLTAVIIKFYILIELLRKKINLNSQIPYLSVIGVLITSSFTDMEWIFMLSRKLFFNNAFSQLFVFWNRISWACVALQYQSLALLIESLLEEKYRLDLRQKFFCFITSCFVLFYIGTAIININCLDISQKTWFELVIHKYLFLYAMFPLMLSSFAITIYKLRTRIFPRLLTKQLTLITLGIICPYWLSDFIQIFSYISAPISNWVNDNYAFVSLSNILITIAIIYCTRKILGLRFLNFTSHVQSPVDINFMQNFKSTLEQFSHLSSLQELGHITQGFFKESFGIPVSRTHLYIRNLGYDTQPRYEFDNMYQVVETFLSTHHKHMCRFMKKAKILIYDELSFSNFYESSKDREESLQFLQALQADLFLPIYENDTLVAYIVVDRHARLNEFYNSTEYDEMLIYASYLGNIINLMQNKNLDSLIQQEKVLQEELYSKHQEINQYKESIRSFLRSNKQKEIGIVFYKNRRFTFGNQAAKELIAINPNMQEGHPITKALKQVAHHVEAYKTAHTVHAKDSNGTKLVFAGVPSLEMHNIIISVYHPEVSDVIKKQIDILKDPSEWDYLLYLETTKPGQLINQLIPGSGETLLNFKIELLKASLTKKATLLNMPEQDLYPMVELLHHISLRETLHVLNLERPVTNFDAAIKLFGINSIYGMKKDTSPALLESLDNVGTLYIKNIHYLDLETQEYLAEFIRYGIYRTFKSEQKIPSNVRIICSTTQNLMQLVRDGKFSQNLFNELKHTTLEMPSLTTLPEAELNTLAEGFSEQAVENQTYKNLLSLTDRDKTKLAHQRPTSLQELKSKVQDLLVQKSKKNDIYHETQLDPSYDLSDPELMHAARLGKQALKDKTVMKLLWNKFGNQNKIASFLGVNRSSVNRRCKQFHLE